MRHFSLPLSNHGFSTEAEKEGQAKDALVISAKE